MARLLWIFGEIIVGALIGGGVSALVVPVTVRAGWNTGPWLLWVVLGSSILVSVVGGERLRRRRDGARAA